MKIRGRDEGFHKAAEERKDYEEKVVLRHNSH